MIKLFVSKLNEDMSCKRAISLNVAFHAKPVAVHLLPLVPPAILVMPLSVDPAQPVPTLMHSTVHLSTSPTQLVANEAILQSTSPILQQGHVPLVLNSVEDAIKLVPIIVIRMAVIKVLFRLQERRIVRYVSVGVPAVVHRIPLFV